MIEWIKVVINNFIPIVKELLSARISKMRQVIVNFRYWRLMSFVFVSVCLLVVFLFNANLSYENLDSDFDVKSNIVDLNKRDVGILNYQDVILSSGPFLDSGNVVFDRPQKQIVVVEKRFEKIKVKEKLKRDFWRVFFVVDDKSLDAKATRWKADLSQMRYICNSNWNRRADVVCKRHDYFCTVAFEIVLDGQKYKVVFRSDVAMNGFDRVSKMKVYVWGQENMKIDIENSKDLVGKIIALRPKCSPFSSD